MVTLLLWALLIGGMPTSGYYLFQYGRSLYERGKQLRARFTEPEEGNAQWRQELAFGGWCCVWAAGGLVLLHIIQSVDKAVQ